MQAHTIFSQIQIQTQTRRYTRPDTCATGKFGEIFLSLRALEVRQVNTVYWDPLQEYDYCWDFNLTKHKFHYHLER